MPDDPDRETLAAAVAWFMRAEYTDAECEQVHQYLDRHLPDPAWTAIIYWPNRHDIAAARGITAATSDEVVEIAFEHRPIAL